MTQCSEPQSVLSGIIYLPFLGASVAGAGATQAGLHVRGVGGKWLQLLLPPGSPAVRCTWSSLAWKASWLLRNKLKSSPPFLLETLVSAAEWVPGKHISSPGSGSPTAAGDQPGPLSGLLKAGGPCSESGPARALSMVAAGIRGAHPCAHGKNADDRTSPQPP